MKTKLIQILGIFVALFLVIGASSQGQAPVDVPDYTVGGDNIEINTDSLVVRVVGGQQVPFFFFWDAEDDTTQYMVMYDAIFEADDTDDDGEYDLGEDTPYDDSYVALARLSWDFSSVEESSDGSLHFNMTSSDGTFQMRNHLYADDDSQLKFDVVIDGYTFSQSDSILVFAFKIQVQGGDDSTEDEGNSVSFGDGFFEIEDQAQDDEGNVDVGLATGSEEGDSKLFMSYRQFTGKLVHDPTIGVQASSGDSGEVHEELLPQGIPKGLLVAGTVIASIVALAIPTTVYRLRKK